MILYVFCILIPQTELALRGSGGIEKRIEWLFRRVGIEVPDAFPLEKCVFGVHEGQKVLENIGCRKVPPTIS